MPNNGEKIDKLLKLQGRVVEYFKFLIQANVLTALTRPCFVVSVVAWPALHKTNFSININ